MIFSNYSHKLLSHANQKYYLLELGTTGKHNHPIQIFGKKHFEIQPGLNPNQNLYFSLHGNILLKETEEDWRCEANDRNWNIPDSLYLLLTSNIYDVKVNVSKNSYGIIQTLKEDALSSFRLYAHGYETFTSRRSVIGVIMFGIYEVKTSKPLIVKIVPPGHQTSPEQYQIEYLLIHSNLVQKIKISEINSILSKYSFSHSLESCDWATI